MILIGQYDSPFVRRVGIALTLYGIKFDHRPLSVFGDGDQVQALNPLMRVPVLVLDDGCVLTYSHMMLDWLDGQVTDPLFPQAGVARRQALQVAALGCGLAEKCVSLFYERRLHAEPSAAWESRCIAQITATLAVLEADRATRATPFWFGDRLSHADIAVACALRFASEVHGDLIGLPRLPALSRHCARLEDSAAFRLIHQPFAAPA